MKFKIEVQMESKKLTKYSLFLTKLHNYFPLTQSKTSPDPKFMKRFAVRILSKINKIRQTADQVQSKTSPMLISDLINKLGLSIKNSEIL